MIHVVILTSVYLLAFLFSPYTGFVERAIGALLALGLVGGIYWVVWLTVSINSLVS